MDFKAFGSSTMILMSNIYYMLAYAFRSLNYGGIGDLGSEEFENINELFSEIIIRGMRRQLKRGLPKGYRNEKEELSNLRGKIDLQTSTRKLTHVKHHLTCDFDEFIEDTPSNRLIKCAITNLIRQSDVSKERKRNLKFLRSSLDNVADIGYRKIQIQRTGGAEYVMLVNVCRFLLEGLLMDTGSGHKMHEWLPDDQMSSLYEHFLVQYFKLHYSKFNARSAYIDWDMTDIPIGMPGMKSDVFLTYGEKILIIDAKFYSSTMSENHGKKIYHSNNLYQIYTYVKNEDKLRSGKVSGMLLYAKTDEDITPDSDNLIGGNMISVKTLDLSQNFEGIRSQLDRIAELLMCN
jgi:5-methylcytosine-specific restriction enzyme subunit McrC